MSGAPSWPPALSRNPGGYHAEWVLPDESAARHLQRVLSHLGLAGRIHRRRGQGILYLKDGDEVSALLKLMEASRAVLSLK